MIAAVQQVRSIRGQAQDLGELLAGRDDAQELKTKLEGVVSRCNALEAELHNPKAEVVYDILAQPGGTQLHSNLAFVFETAKAGDGAPTQGAGEVYAELLAELARHEADLAALKTTDVRAVEDLARALNLPRIFTGEGR